MTRVCSVICVMFCLRCVETKSRFFAYTVRITSMILQTARFLCVTYAEICVNANAVSYFDLRKLSLNSRLSHLGGWFYIDMTTDKLLLAPGHASASCY